MNKRTLCPVCLKFYKNSKEGRKARRDKVSNVLAPWGKECWPSNLYHSGKGRLCPSHTSSHGIRVREKYDERLGVLILNGYQTYGDYLKSPLWQEIRERVFEKFGRICHFCTDQATQIHHEKYDLATIMGDSLRYLIPVCGRCHTDGEFYPSGEKCSPLAATCRMREAGCRLGNTRHIRTMEAIRHSCISLSTTLPAGTDPLKTVRKRLNDLARSKRKANLKREDAEQSPRYSAMPSEEVVSISRGRVQGARPRCPKCKRGLAQNWTHCEGCQAEIRWTS